MLNIALLIILASLPITTYGSVNLCSENEILRCADAALHKSLDEKQFDSIEELRRWKENIKSPEVQQKIKDVDERIQTLLDSAKILMIQTILAGRKRDKVTVDEEAILKRIEMVTVNKFADLASPSRFNTIAYDNCIGGQYMYSQFASNVITICPFALNQVESFMMFAIGHEIGHQFEKCATMEPVRRSPEGEIVGGGFIAMMRPLVSVDETGTAQPMLDNIITYTPIAPAIDPDNHPTNALGDCLKKNINIDYFNPNDLSQVNNGVRNAATAISGSMRADMLITVHRPALEAAIKQLGSSCFAIFTHDQSAESLADALAVDSAGRRLQQICSDPEQEQKCNHERQRFFDMLKLIHCKKGEQGEHLPMDVRVRQLLLKNNNLRVGLGCAEIQNTCKYQPQSDIRTSELTEVVQ